MPPWLAAIGTENGFTANMSPDGYTTVFDVTAAGFKSWSFPAFGLIFVAVGLALVLFPGSGLFRGMRKPAGRWFPWLFLGFSLFWTTTSFWATFSDYRDCVDAVEQKQTSFVEGPVTNFHPMPYGGHASESFVVQGIQFKYSDYIITAGFNHTKSHGGPIREGLLVRIWHRNGEILRLDIKEPPNRV